MYPFVYAETNVKVVRRRLLDVEPDLNGEFAWKGDDDEVADSNPNQFDVNHTLLGCEIIALMFFQQSQVGLNSR